MEIRIPTRQQVKPLERVNLSVDKIPEVAVKTTVSTETTALTNQNDGYDKEAPWGRTVSGAPKTKPGRKPKIPVVAPALKDRYIYRSEGIAGTHPNTHVKVFARPYTEEAVTILVEIMRDQDAPVQARVSAATQVLDRAWGKPKETLELEAPAEGLRKVLNDISSEDLTDLVRALRNPPIDVTPTKADLSGTLRSIPVDAKKPGP